MIMVVFLGFGEMHAQNLGELGEENDEAEGTIRYRGEGITDIEWSAVRTREGNSETVTRVLHSLAGNSKRSLVQEEETVTKVDSETTRVRRTTSNFDSRGDVRVIEVVEENQRVLPSGEEHIERNVLVPDSHGRLSAYRQEIQAKVPVGDNVMMTSTSVFLRNSSGEFEERERIEKSENIQGDTVEVEETTQSIDANGRWRPEEIRRVTISQKEGKPEQEEEHVYRTDSRGRLTLSERVLSKYDQDREGNERFVVETHRDTIAGTRRTSDGKLQLDRRVEIVKKELPGNVEQTIEEVQQRSPANPRSGLQLVERKITTSRPLRSGGRELEIQIQARRGSGRLETIMTQKTTVTD